MCSIRCFWGYVGFGHIQSEFQRSLTLLGNSKWRSQPHPVSTSNGTNAGPFFSTYIDCFRKMLPCWHHVMSVSVYLFGHLSPGVTQEEDQITQHSLSSRSKVMRRELVGDKRSTLRPNMKSEGRLQSFALIYWSTHTMPICGPAWCGVGAGHQKEISELHAVSCQGPCDAYSVSLKPGLMRGLEKDKQTQI